MRLGLWLVACGLGLTFPLEGCAGGYPLPPTKCDEWCRVTRGATCDEWYNPASCVAQCEESNLSVTACSTEFEATLACFRRSPNALHQRCVYDNVPDDCSNEVALLSTCSGGSLYY